MEYFSGEFKSSLNSEDLINPDLSFRANRTKGGTMILWRKYLDPYVTVQEPVSTSFLFLVLNIPGTRPSIHSKLLWMILLLNIRELLYFFEEMLIPVLGTEVDPLFSQTSVQNFTSKESSFNTPPITTSWVMVHLILISMFSSILIKKESMKNL